MATLAFGADIGGTNLRAALVEVESGRVLVAQKSPVGDRSPEGVAQVLAGLVTRLSDGWPVGGVSVGVGFAGMLRGPVVVNAPNLGWREVDFGGLLDA